MRYFGPVLIALGGMGTVFAVLAARRTARYLKQMELAAYLRELKMAGRQRRTSPAVRAAQERLRQARRLTICDAAVESEDDSYPRRSQR